MAVQKVAQKALKKDSSLVVHLVDYSVASLDLMLVVEMVANLAAHLGDYLGH